MPSESESRVSEWSSRSYPVREDMDFQRATWRVERGGWVVVSVVVVLALLGLFAVGPLSSGTVRDGQGRVEVAYERFERIGASSRVRIRLSAAPLEKAVVRIGPSFLEAFTIETVRPQPIEERTGRNGMEMVFSVPGGAPLDLHFSVTPDKAGPVTSEISVDGGASVRLTQFIYP